MDSTIQKKTYTIVITRDEGDVGGFVGMCDELYANSQVETYDEIMENMKEAVELVAEESGNTSDSKCLQYKNNSKNL